MDTSELERCGMRCRHKGVFVGARILDTRDFKNRAGALAGKEGDAAGREGLVLLALTRDTSSSWLSKELWNNSREATILRPEHYDFNETYGLGTTLECTSWF